ncbi:hypothetical protein ACS0TY_033497 [Phlomoides rotata]
MRVKSYLGNCFIIYTESFQLNDKGILRDGTQVTVKSLSAESKQGINEFLTEINMISNIHTQTLLISNGKQVELNWSKRAAICLGTASGLAFLHEDAEPGIVHRDIKASNVLLEENFLPKIGDFGLAKLFPDNVTHVSTRVAGTLGYLAREYALLGQLTKKADVCSLGVLILEIISGRNSSKAAFGEDFHVLLEWTWKLYNEGRLLDVVDPDLIDYPKDEINAFHESRTILHSSSVSAKTGHETSGENVVFRCYS